MKPFFVISLITICLGLNQLVFAYVLNYGFLDDTVGVYFNDKDWDIFYKAQTNALNNKKDGLKTHWKNPQSGNWGSFVASNSTVKKGIYCRKLTIVNAANYRIGQSTLTFCKLNGKWKGI